MSLSIWIRNFTQGLDFKPHHINIYLFYLWIRSNIYLFYLWIRSCLDANWGDNSWLENESALKREWLLVNQHAQDCGNRHATVNLQCISNYLHSSPKIAEASQNPMKESFFTPGDCRVSSTIDFTGRKFYSSLEVICSLA